MMTLCFSNYINNLSNNSSVFILAAFFICGLKYGSSQYSNADSLKPCGTLYSEPSSRHGTSFSFSDQDTFLDFTETGRFFRNCRNSTDSIVIEHDCKLKLCNETYLEGTCHTFGNIPQTENDCINRIASAQCTCAKQCKCSDIHIKKSFCGRAYLEGGCRTCDALYIDLDQHNPFFPDEFADKIEAIRLRKGCSLTIYSEEDFEGDETIITNEVVEDFKGNITSYECECNDALYEPVLRTPRPESSYPSLVDIPASTDDVLKMLGYDTYKNHPGLLAARTSYRSGRSSKNAYILVLGWAGSGKSSTINMLLDNTNVAKVPASTGGIQEYRIPVTIKDELGIINSELRIIYTPGLGDTRGLENDAKFLATLDNYLSRHEELKDRIPNAVLMVHKFPDDHFMGSYPSFLKMLHGFESITKRITDRNFSNVIFVLSQFCSETKATTRKPERRINAFKDAIQNQGLYPRPTHIVVAENNGNDYLPKASGSFKLPNNEYYPRNLVEKLELVAEKGGDPIGLAIFRDALRSSEDFNNVTSRAFPIITTKTTKVKKYMNLLTHSCNISVVKTEIAGHLQKVWDLELDERIRKWYMPYSKCSLPYLQKALSQSNITRMKDIPQTSQGIMELLSMVKRDQVTLVLLEKGLNNITSPVFPSPIIAGYGYTVFQDTPLPTSPFEMGKLEISDSGFLIPETVTCKLEPGTREHFMVFEDSISYLEHRLETLGVYAMIAPESDTDAIKPGHNIRALSCKNESCSFNAAVEFRTFLFALKNKLELTQEFKDVVKALPPFNLSDLNIVEKWNQFFSKYGTHIVRSVYGGGAIEIQLESSGEFNEGLNQTAFDLMTLIEDISCNEIDGVDVSRFNKTVLGEGSNKLMTFVGGQFDIRSVDLASISVAELGSLVGNWRKSLKFSPVILKAEMKLLPISKIVRKLGRNYSMEIDKVARLLFQSKVSNYLN